MPQIDFTSKPNFVRPELLQHGQIPRPLAGVAPRIVLGQDWWDIERKKAYEANKYCCWACGEEAALEAHEAYTIDYMKLTMTFTEVVALCSKCHGFIHIGRSRIKMTEREFKALVLRGVRLLKKAKLKANWGLRAVLSDAPWAPPLASYIMATPLMRVSPPWNAWRLVIASDKYPPKFKNIEEASKFYEEKDNG